jgi:hypothetical protein
MIPRSCRREGPVIPRSPLATAPVLAVLMSGCIWLPNWPFPDTTVPGEDFAEDDSQLVSHCAPHQDPRVPVLLRRGTTPTSFSCRVRGEDSVLWTVRIPGEPSVRDYIVATGVEELAVHADDLPWAPRPYRAELEIAVRQGTTTRTSHWQLVVMSHADDVARVEASP